MTSFDVVDHALIARPSDDIDTANAAALEEELAASLQREPDHLIVDLGDVRFIDSAGIGMLIRLGERLRQRRSRLVVVIPQSSPLVRIAEIVDLPAAVPVYPTVADAVAGSASQG
jgi:anti-anti-sigma factor